MSVTKEGLQNPQQQQQQQLQQVQAQVQTQQPVQQQHHHHHHHHQQQQQYHHSTQHHSHNPSQLHHLQHTATALVPMQAAATAQPIVPQGSPQVGQQQQATMTQVMQQGPQQAHSPHGVATSMTPQSPQFYVQASLASGMQQAPPAIAPAPGPQTNTTTVSALHQPLQHHLAAQQTLTHAGVNATGMPQFSPQVQVIQGSLPGGPYLQQLYQNAQGQLIMPSNLTLQTPAGMNATQLQGNALNGLNQPIQVITAATGKPFQGQLAPHMLTTASGKAGVLQGGQTGYSPTIPTSTSQTLVIGQLPVGVISSQQPNILPAQSATHKSNDMQQKQQSISWATPGSLHSGALLQNQPIFIRGTQPGQDVFISSPQTQTMHAQNSMMTSLQSMQQGQQIQKPRSGMEIPANIQPKAPNMRPPILPSNPTQIRPGASVSTQTAGQQMAPGSMSAPRAQKNMRGKGGANRTSPAMAANAQMATAHQVAQVQQVSQNVTAVASNAVAVNTATQVMQQQQAVIAPVSIQNPITSICGPNKMISQATPMQTISSMTQTKPGIPMTPLTAPLPPAGQPPPNLPQLVRAPTPKQQQQAMANIPQVSVAPSPPVLLPCSTVQASTETQSLTTQASMTAPVLVPQSLPTSQTCTTVTQVSGPLQPPSLVSLPPPVSSAVVQPKQEVKVESVPSPNKKVNSVTPNSATSTTQVTGTTTSVAQAQPQQLPQEQQQQHHHQTPPTLIASNGTPTSSESGEVNDKTPQQQPTMNGTIHPVAPQPPTSGPPKAMVKPQVLTHVIEGFVIHEASEPFPVSRSNLLTEISKPRPPNYTNTVPVTSVTSSSAQPPLGGGQAEKENLPDDDARIKANEHNSSSPKELATCELCGKTDLRSKFKRSKRFCSNACAKRYNVGCSKRIGLFRNAADEPPNKRLREDGTTIDELKLPPQLEMAESQETDQTMLQAGENMVEEDEDESLTPESPSKSQRVDILKWTVKDVVDFIENLPGCKEYAEDFALQEIDGQALMLLKADHLMSAMSMKLGPALKICAKIESMRGDRKET